MAGTDRADQDYLPLADIEINAVKTGRTEFILTGRGADRADYRIAMHSGVPIDQRTSQVLGEIFAQSDWRILRRARQPLHRGPQNRQRSEPRKSSKRH